MPKVNVDVNSKYNAQETFSKIKSLFGENSDLKKLDPKMNATFNDSAMSATAKGDKFSADLQVQPQGDSSSVSITVELPMLLGMLKGQVKSTIEKKLSGLLS